MKAAKYKHEPKMPV